MLLTLSTPSVSNVPDFMSNLEVLLSIIVIIFIPSSVGLVNDR